MGIRLTNAFYKGVVDMLESMDETTEFESRIDRETQRQGSGATKMKYFQFKRALVYMIQKHKNNKTHAETLDISMGEGMRLSLEGIDNILYFCKQDTIQPNKKTTLMMKRAGKRSRLAEYDIVFKTSSEITQDITPGFLANLQNETKHYRLKKRISVLSIDQRFQFDFTVVKSSTDGNNHKMTQSDFGKGEDVYEIEIEYIGNKTNLSPPQKTAIVNDMFEHMSELLKIVDDVEYLVSNTQRYKVLDEYAKLAYNKEINMMAMLADIRTRTSMYFVGPKPVTLEKKHLVATELERASINNNYTVTDKADGERHVLFIDNTGHCFLINNRLTIKDTNLVSKHKNSLFDCEVVKITSYPKRRIMLFDTFFYNGANKTALPLMKADDDTNTRLSCAKELASEKLDAASKYEILAKQFYICTKDNSIFSIVDTLLKQIKSRNIAYKCDGLIFTPADVPIGASKVGDEPILRNTWALALKWKPPTDNTIDFLVKVVKDIDGKDNVFRDNNKVLCKTLKLYLGRNMQTITPWEFFANNEKGNYQQRNNKYVDYLFIPEMLHNVSAKQASLCVIPLDDKGRMVSEDGDEILDHTIVEMYFNITEKAWKPLRVREDKTEQYRNTNKISETANDFDIANKTWETIIEPVEEKHITGKEKVEVQAEKLEYYKRNNATKRDDTDTFAMKVFHNRWIKQYCLIDKFKKINAKSLMDPACGMGGDLFKWIEAGFTKVLGLDLSEANITLSENNAYARLSKAIQTRRMSKGTHTYAFLPMDSSIAISAQTIKGMPNPKHQALARFIWGIETPKMHTMQPLYKMASNKFDVISCQFAIHYFFKTDDTLKGFIENVDNHIKPGGYFIGTCFDGHTIHDQVLKTVNSGQVVYGSKNDKKIWSIRRMYDDDFKPMTTGVKIKVFVETINDQNDEYDEYLVYFEHLANVLAEKGIRLLSRDECKELDIDGESTGMFDQSYDAMIKKTTNAVFDKTNEWMNVAKEMSPDEKRLSFMYRWFIFKKDANWKSKATRKEKAKDEEIQEIKPIVKKQKEESDDDDEEKIPPPPIVKLLPVKKAPVKKTVAKKEESDDDEDEDEEKIPSPPVVKLLPVKKAPVKKTVAKKEESEDEDEDEEKIPSPPVVKKLPVKKVPVVKKTVAKKEESEDEDEDEDEDKEKIPSPPVVKKLPVKKVPVVKKTVAKKEESDEDEEEEEEAKVVKKLPVKKVPVKKTVAKKEESEDEDEEEEAKVVKKAPVKKAPVKKTVAKKEESDDDDDEKEVVKKPASRKTKASK